MKDFSRSRGSRVFHLMMILPAGVLLLLLCLITIGSLAATNADAKKVINQPGKGTCMLFVKSEGKGTNRLTMKPDNLCNFPVGGTVILLVLSVAFSVLLVVKAVMGVNLFSMSGFIELITSMSGAVIAFIVAVVITAGLDATCDAAADSYNAEGDIPCCSFAIYNIYDSSKRIFFFERFHTARVSAWLITVLLFLLSAAYAILLCINNYRRKKNRASSNNTNQDSSLDDPVKNVGSA